MPTRVRTSGVIIVLVGAWGALVPFVGPLFGYRMGNVEAWTWSESHLTLHLLPGVVAILGGALALSSARRRARLGSALALLGGAWFILAPTLHPLWAASTGMMMGDSVWSQIASSLGYHYGTGVVITTLAAYALGALGKGTSDVPDVATPATGREGSGGSMANEREPAGVA